MFLYRGNPTTVQSCRECRPRLYLMHLCTSMESLSPLPRPKLHKNSKTSQLFTYICYKIDHKLHFILQLLRVYVIGIILLSIKSISLLNLVFTKIGNGLCQLENDRFHLKILLSEGYVLLC